MTSIGFPVQHSSQDFAIVEYLLQLNLSAPQLKISELYDISRSRGSNEFNSYVKSLPNTNVVDAFLPLSVIHQPLSDIAENGIRIPKNGLRVQIDKCTLPEKRDNYELIHLIVALGKVANYQAPASDVYHVDFANSIPTINDIPPGFNSLCVSNNNEYLLFQSSQVKAVHYIKFSGGANLIHEYFCNTICGVCGCKNATLWCENDSIKLCTDCDKKTHEGNPVFSAHSRIPLQDAIPRIHLCHYHPSQKVAYFCQKCNLPICLECKVSGSHSQGENARHRLIPIAQAYEETKAAVNRINPTYVTRSQILSENVRKAENLLLEISLNEENVEKEIMRLAHEAITQAKIMAAQRASVVKSALGELERKRSELNTLQNSIKQHSQNSSPLDFLRVYSASIELEKEIQNHDDLPEFSDIFADLMVYGRLQVAPDRNLARQTDNVVARDIPETTVEETELPDQDDDVPHSFHSSQVEIVPKITKISRVASRKLSRYQASGISISQLPFSGSEILIDPKISMNLFLALPFKVVPGTHLLFSTTREGRSITKMHRFIDGQGISVVLIKAGEYVFGGFAATKWNNNGIPFGETSNSFLFSINNDAIIPYNPQVEDPCKLYGTDDCLSFGHTDLVLSDNFDGCSSDIENSYGVGLGHNSEAASRFLAGTPKFKAEIVEVWGFYSLE